MALTPLFVEEGKQPTSSEVRYANALALDHVNQAISNHLSAHWCDPEVLHQLRGYKELLVSKLIEEVIT